MKAPPEVAVVACHLPPGRVTGWVGGAYGVPESYVDALRRAGGSASLVLPDDRRTPTEILARFDALLLVGGGDVEPRRSGQGSHQALRGLEPDRDRLEIDLLHAADTLGRPTLCVCRGMQVMNVAFGGTLIQHLPDDDRFMPHETPSRGSLLHDVAVEPGSRLALVAGGEALSCSSHHHQGIDGLGAGLVATGRSADGLVEAIEREGDGWMVGVQWHPEDTAAVDPGQQRLFDALVHRAG